QFLGTWYVIEETGRHANCMTFTFTKQSATQLTVTQAMEFKVLDRINIDYLHSNTGTLEILPKTNKSQMRIKGLDNVSGSSKFSIVETDYSGYALIVECKKLLFRAQTNVAILSREPIIDPALHLNLKVKINELGLNATKLIPMKHENCIQPQDSENVDPQFIREQIDAQHLWFCA
ncbi:unnamed protein product, partial [Meganyctiphanes norvegica]